MFFAIIFLSLAALGSYLFPAWSWAAILGTAFGCVAMLRLLLLLGERQGKPAEKSDPS
ncbi:hypothetical protein [Azonexus sp.]|uniref:hypothetical protein n=1 Tax=Azonexus sp. TaxID=1872668 RepID=UPI0027BAE934|nr:hypothetical protein [Azonexus sp.]